MGTATAGGPVTAAAEHAPMGTDGPHHLGGGARCAAARSERQTTTRAVTLLRGHVDRLVGGREVVVGAAAVTRAATLLAARPAWRRRGRSGGACGLVGGRGVGQGIGGVMGCAAAAVEALLEQADFGFEVGEALLQLGLALLEPVRTVGLALGEEVFASGCA
ncbi:MAG: hypothetical protein L0Z62_45950 [Gemmataceae bacterium]|nr:hypothetical protein [Gemmataceae bacterium]